MDGAWFVDVFLLIVQLSECRQVTGISAYTSGDKSLVLNYRRSGKLAMEATNRPGTTRFGAFEVYLRSGEVYKHGIRLKLQDQPFQVLAVLLEHPGDLVTREELGRKLWPSDTFVHSDTGPNS